MNIFKQLASYLYPINLKRVTSKRSGSLELTLVDGKLVLDSENANYSYGSLQKVLKKGLQQFDIEKLKCCKNILILGVAGGSIIDTLQNDFKLKNAKITGVEIDETVLNLAKDYFKINQKPNVELILADAFEFIKTTTTRYDLIVIDIFNDCDMPTQLFEIVFWKRISNTLTSNGLCLFNSIITSNTNKQRNTVLNKYLLQLFTFSSRKRTAINELFILEK